MFRTLVMFPATADPEEVAETIDRTAAAFRERPTFRGMTTNVDALMGPSAKRGDVGALFEADFGDLGDLLGVLDDEGFRDVRDATEALDPTLLLFEYRDV